MVCFSLPRSVLKGLLMTHLLLLSALVILACVLCNKLSS